MKKGSKILGLGLIVLAIVCFAMYFLYSKPSDYKVTFDSDGGSLVTEQIVKVGEKLGVCFEMLDCMSLKTAVLTYPNKLKE